MDNSTWGIVPMLHRTIFSKSHCPSINDEIERMSRILYTSTVGSIMYSMTCIRLDVAYALSMTRYQANRGEKHWMAIKNILMYLRRTKDMFLVYR